MALRFVDSFDHYDSDDITHKYNKLDRTVAGSVFIDSSEGRFGTGALVIDDWLTGNYVAVSLDDQGTWIVGFAFKITDTLTDIDLQGPRPIVALIDGFIGFGNNDDTAQVKLKLDHSHRLSLWRGKGSEADETLLARSDKALPQGTYEYIELKVVVNASGSYELRVNGEIWLSGSADTTITSNNSANVIVLGQIKAESNPSNSPCFYDDLYICDGTGAKHNDFLGDVRVEQLRPNASAQEGWVLFDVGSSAVSNFEVVDDDNSPDDESTYVAGSVAGQRDLYGFTQTAIQAGTIYALQTSVYARKTGPGSRTIRPVVVASGTHQGGIVYFDGSYYYLRELFDENPNTTDQWLFSDINAIQLGMDIES
jgi:hypothetical protein